MNDTEYTIAITALVVGAFIMGTFFPRKPSDSDQLLHDIALCDGWLRTDSTRELWERLQAWKRDHHNKGLDVK